MHHYPSSINGLSPDDEDAIDLLHDLGFYEHLKFNAPRSPRKRDGSFQVRFISMISGIRGSGHHGAKLQEIVFGTHDAGANKTIKVTENVLNDLHRGLNEAMANVGEHAYPEKVAHVYPPMPNERWWLAGYRNIAEREIVFMAYDQGVGIPRSMRRTKMDFMREFFSDPASAIWGASRLDRSALVAAMELGETRTGRTERGKGLNDFCRLIDRSGGDGSLTILSGRGKFTYDGRRKSAVALPLPFAGTMIIWRLARSPAIHWPEVFSHGNQA